MKKLPIVLFFVFVITGLTIFVIFGPKEEPKEEFGSVIMSTNNTEGVIFSGLHGKASMSVDVNDDTVIVEGDLGTAYATPSVGDPIMFNTASSFDDGILTESTVYYVRTASLSDRFEVSATKGGAVVDFASTASLSGEHFFTTEVPANTFNVQGLNYITLSVAAEDAASLSLKFLGSIQSDIPDWYVAQSNTNRWETVGVFDIATQTEIEGDTGINFAGTDDVRILDVYTKGLNWISVVSSNFASGSVDLKIRGEE